MKNELDDLQVETVNEAAEMTCVALGAFQAVCDKSGHPISGVTFLVRDDGTSWVHVRYKRKNERQNAKKS